jgi:biopolymer transport protein TolR|nr:biopolymer transporter ExbD [Candidatus Krumholzibacteria bacterium]
MTHRVFDPKSGIMGINVTPIIDVALVLVIILMITTPIMTISNLSVELPAAHVRSAEEGDRLNITVNAAGEIALDKTRIEPGDLVGSLGARLNQPGQSQVMVVVRADGSASHAVVRRVLDQAHQAGARRLAIATTAKNGRQDQELTWKP